MPGAEARAVESGGREGSPSGSRYRRPSTRVYELLVALPLLAWFAFEIHADHRQFLHPQLLLWVVAIAIVDLMPVATGVDLRFSLSFPLQLAVALIYLPPAAGLVAFLGTSDSRELRRELPLAKALVIRAQIA